jgi:hypothetical protein
MEPATAAGSHGASSPAVTKSHQTPTDISTAITAVVSR